MANRALSRQYLLLIPLFLVAFGFFLFLQSKAVFPDPDSFYHIKVAQLLSERGVFDAFPWLSFTNLAASYTDQHFLYHVLLIPFVTNMDPIFGAKFATVILNAALISLFAALLMRFRVRLWPIAIAILLVTNPFLFRINLVKAPEVSIILLLIGVWLLLTRRVWPLAFLSFIYVWTYGGFVLLGLITLLYALISALFEWRHRRMLVGIFRRFVPHRIAWNRLLTNSLAKQLYAVGGGTVAGVLINPYFPQNLFFYWQQLVQIGIVNFQKVVNVGGEWRPYGFIELLANNVFVSIAVLVTLVLFVVYRKRQSAESITFFVLFLFFFLITLKSRRYVELYVPFSVLFASFATRDALLGVSFASLWKRFTRFFYQRTVVATLLTLYIVAATLTIIAKDERQLNNDLKNGFRADYLAGASAWLQQNTPQGSIVVHSDWDDFPVLFYHNSHNYYIVGLDPTFMYQHDKRLYQRWAELTMGKRTTDAGHIITRDLHSTTVIVAKDHGAFRSTMDHLVGFKAVFEDDDAIVYQAIQPRE